MRAPRSSGPEQYAGREAWARKPRSSSMSSACLQLARGGGAERARRGQRDVRPARRDGAGGGGYFRPGSKKIRQIFFLSA